MPRWYVHGGWSMKQSYVWVFVDPEGVFVVNTERACLLDGERMMRTKVLQRLETAPDAVGGGV